MYSLRVHVLCISALTASAVPPPGYYSSAEGKTGQELRHDLHSIIRDHTVIPYSSSSFDTSDALMVLDEDPTDTNNVLLIYAQRSEPKWLFGAAHGWNREHLWPNSYGLDDRHPAYSDLHNLRPEDATVNTVRGNKYYNISETNHTSYRFPAHPEAEQCSTDFDSWNPPDTVKGDIARAIFYMDVRYEGSTGSEPDLIVTEGVTRITSATNFMGRLVALLHWHELDPVDDAERLRNDRVFTLYQHNRNPFVDHPQWVPEVFWPGLSIAFGRPNDRFPTNTMRVAWSGDFTNAMLQNDSSLPPSWIDRSPGDLEPDGMRAYYALPSGLRRYYRPRLW